MKKYSKWFVIGLFFLVLQSSSSLSTTAASKDTGCNIVFALDISGSMKTTDENRTAIETIKMVIDLCDSTDNVGVVAYNDTIAYCYDLTPLSTREKRSSLKQNLDLMEYKGETDIGLGLKKAVELLYGEGEQDNSMVILLSDGKTDLEHSTTQRTLEQSQQDLNEAIALAKEKNIKINTIGFANEYLKEGDYLTVISANTGGSSQIAASPLQLNQLIQSVIFQYKNGENETTKVLDTTGELQTETIEFKAQYVRKAYISILSTGSILEASTKEEKSELISSEKYAILKLDNPKTSKVTFQLKAAQGETVIVNVVEVKGEAPTKAPTATLQPTKVPTREAMTITPVPDTTDSKKEKVVLWSIIAGISLATLGICIFIVYLFFGKDRKEKYPEFQGKLVGQFIDLKSKNEPVKLQWQLEEYPQEGATLKELFAGANFKEDLPGIERLCFYPEKHHKILLVHCMEGGVFLGENNVPANVPVKVQQGDTVYISFAENSSELELVYM